LKERDQLEGLGVDGRLILRILKWIFKKGGEEYFDWIHWAQGRDRWQALVNAVVNLQVP